MSTQADANTARTAALAVFTTGVAGDLAREALTWALVEQARGGPVPALSVDGDTLDDLVQFAHQHRVEALTGRIVPEIGATAIGRLAGAIAIERHLLEAVELLEGTGVETLVLKGNATARLDHEDPSDREVGDIDLLVRPAQLTLAMGALEQAGHVRVVTHPFARPSFFHSETLVHPDGTEIDLHHRLAQPSRPPFTCWAEPDSFRLGGRTVLALPRAWRFTHALVHQLKDSPPSVRAVNGLLDLVVMWTNGVDVVSVRRAAQEIGLPSLVERGLGRLTDLLGEPTPAPPSEIRTSWAEGKLAAALDSAEPTPGYLALAANLAVQPRWLWPSYLRQLVWPTKAYRDELGVTLGGQLRHVAREAVGR